jgi:murein DD-endopeptidase MepM/ murein hydrolase activator NlpD
VGGILFGLAILLVNYLVFFRGDADAEPTLEQRLASPVEVLPLEELDALAAQAAPQTAAPELVEATLGRGDTSANALARVGVSRAASAAALEALASEIDMRGLRPGQKYIAGRLPDGSLAFLRFPIDRVRYIEVASGEDGWTVSRQEVPTRKETIEFACMIAGSLYESLNRCGADPALAPIVADLLGGQIDFHTDVRKGDVLRVVVDRETLGGEFLRYGRIHGLLFEGKMVTGGAFPWDGDDGAVAYYDPDGNGVERPFLRSPLKYTRVSSDYTNRRLHPILRHYTPHRAIDYAAPVGTPVHAIGPGKVIFAGRKGANGNLIVVQHQDGFQSYYAHLSRFAKGLKVGSQVAQRTLFGSVGSTGRSTGPHLHFAVAKNGKFVHPRTLLEVRGSRLDDALKTDFQASVGRITGRLKSLPVRGNEATKS